MNRTIRALALVIGAIWLAGCGGAEERAQKYLEAAQAAFDEGDYIKAELDAKNTLQIEPTNFDAMFLMAEISEKQDRPRDLFRYLRGAVDINPSNVEAQVKLGRIWAAGRQIDEATASVEAIRAVEPQNPEADVLEAIIRYQQGERDEAKAQAERVLGEHPRNISALTFLASWYQQNGDLDRSLELLDEAIEYEPENRSLREIKVALLQGAERPDDVEAALRELIARFPDDNRYHYLLERFLTAEGRTEEAEQVLRDLVAADQEDLTAKLRLAQFLTNSGDVEKGISALRQYIQDQPDVYEYRFALGQVFAATQRLDEAGEVFDAIIERDGDNAAGLQARTKLAALEYTRGNRERGNELVAEVLEKEAANADALVMRASVAITEQRANDAISDLRTVLRGDPTRENAQLLLGKAHVLAGERNLAIESLQKLVDTHPENVVGRKDLARLLIQEGRWEDVRGLLAVGVQQQPEDLTLARMYVDTLMRLEAWDEADAEADRILALDPTKALGHYVKARVAQSQGDYEDSINYFKVALDLNPDAVETLTGLARSYVRSEDPEGAMAFLEGFVADHPENVQGLALLGEMQARAGNIDEAIATNERALEIREGWLPAYRNLIGIYLQQEDLEKANGVIDRGLEIAPDNTELNLLRANVLERTGRFAEAIEVYGSELEKNPNLDVAVNNFIALVSDHQTDDESLRTALRYGQRFQNTQNPIFQDTLGWLYYRMGNYDEALPLLESAVARAGQLPQLRYHLGMTYYRLDQLDLARTELQAALADDSAEYAGRDEAQETLELL